MKILLVEDEERTGRHLQQGLEENCFVVDVIGNGFEAVRLLGTRQYDVVVLDVMLPGLTGWDVLADIRTRGQSMPVLFLTARDQVEDRVKGLELGADDYLVKPFAFTELLARVRTLLRRAHAREPAVLRVESLEIDLLRHRVQRDGQRVDLTVKEFALLELLARRQGEVLSRTFLASQVWGVNFDTDTNVIDVAIRRLRSKIDNPYPSKLVHTVRGMGYVLEVRSS